MPMDLDDFAEQFLGEWKAADSDGRMNEEISWLTQEQLLRVTDLLGERTRRKQVSEGIPTVRRTDRMTIRARRSDDGYAQCGCYRGGPS